MDQSMELPSTIWTIAEMHCLEVVQISVLMEQPLTLSTIAQEIPGIGHVQGLMVLPMIRALQQNYHVVIVS